jgi:hypothetical protein
LRFTERKNDLGFERENVVRCEGEHRSFTVRERLGFRFRSKGETRVSSCFYENGREKSSGKRWKE